MAIVYMPGETTSANTIIHYDDLGVLLAGAYQDYTGTWAAITGFENLGMTIGGIVSSREVGYYREGAG